MKQECNIVITFFSILYLTSTEIIFTIYNLICIVLITFAIETNITNDNDIVVAQVLISGFIHRKTASFK